MMLGRQDRIFHSRFGRHLRPLPRVELGGIELLRGKFSIAPHDTGECVGSKMNEHAITKLHPCALGGSGSRRFRDFGSIHSGSLVSQVLSCFMDKRTDKKPAGFWRKNFPTLLYILCIPTKRWFLYCLGIFAILLCSDVTLAWWWRHVPISYQTTRITSPLRPDGTVDYIAALNQICGKDVTPDNNAVVDLLKAVGTNSIPDVVQADYLKLLGTQQT